MIGTILGLAALGIGLLDFFTGQERQRKQDLVDNTALLQTTRTTIRETEGKIGGYEDFLARMPVAGEALTETTGDLEFDAAYRGLLQNFGEINVLAGATGRVGAGTSMAAIGQQAQQDILDLVDTTTEQKQRQLDILKESLPDLQATETAVLDAMNLLPRAPTVTPQPNPGADRH